MKRLAIASLAVIGSTLSMHAQDSHFGIQATLSQPQGDLGSTNSLDGQLGYGLGLQVQVGLQGGWALVPRLDYITYKRSESVTTHYPVLDLTLNTDLKASLLYLGADFNYYIGGSFQKGFYLLGGLGYSNGKFDTSITGQAPNEYGNVVDLDVSGSDNLNAFYFSAGCGFQFNPHVGTELRYIGLNKYSKNGHDMTSPSTNLSIVIRF